MRKLDCGMLPVRSEVHYYGASVARELSMNNVGRSATVFTLFVIRVGVQKFHNVRLILEKC